MPAYVDGMELAKTVSKLKPELEVYQTQFVPSSCHHDQIQVSLHLWDLIKDLLRPITRAGGVLKVLHRGPECVINERWISVIIARAIIIFFLPRVEIAWADASGEAVGDGSPSVNPPKVCWIWAVFLGEEEALRRLVGSYLVEEYVIRYDPIWESVGGHIQSQDRDKSKDTERKHDRCFYMQWNEHEMQVNNVDNDMFN